MEGIMERYGLKETIEEAYDKAMEGKETIREKMGEIVYKLAAKEIKVEDLPLILKEKFNLEEKLAVLMAEDLKKEILEQIEELEKEKPIEKRSFLDEKEKKEIPKEKEGEEITKRDLYREPID